MVGHERAQAGYQVHDTLESTTLFRPVIVAFHVASGAAGGALARSRLRALALAPVLHLFADVVPHEDVPSHRFELASGAAGVALLAVAFGPLDRRTLGALASSLPDVEHGVRLPRPGGRKLFPSHRWGGGHTRHWVPASIQLVAAGALLGGLVASSRSWRS